MLQHLHGQVRAVSEEYLMQVHDCPLLAGNLLDFYIQYPGYCKKLQHLHAQVQAVTEEYSMQEHDACWISPRLLYTVPRLL